MRHKRRIGFSMLELSVVIAIIALIVGAGITIGSSAIATAKRIQTKERLETIRYAIEAYTRMNDYLPYPANRAYVPTDADFGREVRPAVASSPGLKTLGAGATLKWIGMVPVRTLGLPDAYAADAWGNKFNYTMMDQLGTDFKSTTVQGMSVYIAQLSTSAADDNTASTDRSVVPSTQAEISKGGGAGWAVVSYGPDGEGAFRYTDTSVATPCVSGGNEDYRYNCNEDGSFRDLQWNDGLYHYARRYDDMMVWGSNENDRPPVTTGQPPLCATGCEAWCAPCSNNLNTGAPANLDVATRNLCRKYVTSTSPCQATCVWSGTLTAGPRKVMCP